ncbi:pyridoxamine 5'-phosphate oxidase family protein [Kineococcus sp. LSe6-4]|uniref:Pyridoxamine 5'-phosphate oxidase family protein n=1 Tax=Kineococcus halophytocola TaxID=3234027 RepID=A0ABV4H439_9ACTN
MERDDRDGVGAVTVLPEHECWRLLRAQTHGRLAFTAADGRPDVRPVNHVVDGGSVVVRTHAGGSLPVPDRPRSGPQDLPVAFEVDGLEAASGTDGPGHAWSVVLRGNAAPVEGLGGALDVGALPLAPFWAGAGHVVLRVTGTVSGRRLPLTDPARWRPGGAGQRGPVEG